MDSEEEKYQEALKQLERDLKPKNFKDPRTLIEKYGNDINDDFTFMILTASIIFKHEDNTSDRLYDKDLAPISDKIRQLEKSYGLADDEYFSVNQQPPDIKDLSDQFDKVLDEKLVKLFRGYGLNDFAEAYEKDKDQFLERFYKIKDQRQSKTSDPVRQIVNVLENEASGCAKNGFYNAASILISSAIEGVLYHGCSGNIEFIKELIEHNKKKNSDKNIVQLNFNELTMLADKAGLLPSDKVPEVKKLLELVNHIRNLIHPGRRLATDYHNIGENEYIFLYGIFMGLKETYKLS